MVALSGSCQEVQLASLHDEPILCLNTLLVRSCAVMQLDAAMCANQLAPDNSTAMTGNCTCSDAQLAHRMCSSVLS